MIVSKLKLMKGEFEMHKNFFMVSNRIFELGLKPTRVTPTDRLCAEKYRAAGKSRQKENAQFGRFDGNIEKSKLE